MNNLRQLKKILVSFIVILIFNYLVFSQYRKSKDGFRFNLDSRVYTNLISGSTEQSVLKEGIFHEEALILEYNKKFISGLNVKSGVSFRFTNDKQLSGNLPELRNYYFTMFAGDESYFLSFGNNYANYSKYVLGRNVEGLLGKVRYGNTLFIPVYGQITRAENDKNYQRIIYGVRSQTEFSNKLRFGINYLNTYDNKDSVKTDASIFSQEENSVVSIDGNLDFGKLYFEGEVAGSIYNELKKSVKENDVAYRIKGKYRYSDFRAEAEYEIVGTSFSALSGWAIKDRVITKVRSGYTFSQWLDTEVVYETYHNNLQNFLPYKEIASIPQINFNFVFGKIFDAQTNYKIRKVYSDDANKTIDREVNTIGGGINFKLKKIRPSVNIEWNNNIDQKNNVNNYKNLFTEISLRTTFGNEKTFWQLYPYFGYRTITDNLEINNKSDTTTTIIFRLNTSAGKYFELNGNFLKMVATKDITNSKSFRDNIYFDIKYKIKGSQDKILSLSYTINDCEQQTIQIVKYLENIFEVGLQLKF